MELLLHRYRNLTVLVVVILAQLLVLAYQVRNDEDVRLIRVWAVTAVSPVARLLDSGRGGVSGFIDNYFALWGVREENAQLKQQLNQALLENHRLRSDLATADRVEALALFQKQSPMKMLTARLFMNTTNSGTTVYVDVGESSGVRPGMPVITPTGIVGKVLSVYPGEAMVRLATDPSFAAGVVSQKNRVRGILKGQGGSTAMVDFVQNEQAVEEGEWFYTSGDDLVFPKGLPAGVVIAARPGRNRKEILVTPSGFQNGVEEVLIVLEGIHAPIPEAPQSSAPLLIQEAPPPSDAMLSGLPAQTGPLATDADHVLERNRRIGTAQGHVFGERGKGAPDLNVEPKELPAAPSPPANREGQ